MNLDIYYGLFVVKGTTRQVVPVSYDIFDDSINISKVYQYNPELGKKLNKLSYFGQYGEIKEEKLCVFKEMGDYDNYFNLDELEHISEKEFYRRKQYEELRRENFKKFDL